MYLLAASEFPNRWESNIYTCKVLFSTIWVSLPSHYPNKRSCCWRTSWLKAFFPSPDCCLLSCYDVPRYESWILLTLFIHLQGTIRRATYFEPQKANKKYWGESRPWGNLFIYLVYILWCQHIPLPPGALNMLSEKYRAINSFFFSSPWFFFYNCHKSIFIWQAKKVYFSFACVWWNWSLAESAWCSETFSHKTVIYLVIGVKS